MDSLEKLLRRNYARLRDDECTDAVLRFLRITPSVHGMPPVFVKMLVKVSHHILKQDPQRVDGLLERLLKITTQGIDIVRRLPVQRRFDGDTSLHSHLWTYHADFAGELYKRTGNPSYALLQYESRVQAASLTENRNSEYVAKMNIFATKAARTLFDATKEQKWADTARGHAELALQFYAWIKNKEEVASCQFDIAMIAKDVMRIFPTGQNGRRLYADTLKAAERCSETEKKEAFARRFVYEAAKAAGWLAEHAKDAAAEKTKSSETETDEQQDARLQRIEWLERQHDCLRTAACLSIRRAPGKSVGNYLQARNTAKKLYKETGDKVWLELAFDSQASAAMIAEETGEARTARLYQTAAHDARDWYSRVRCRNDEGVLEKDGHIAKRVYECRQKAAVLYVTGGNLEEAKIEYGVAERFAQHTYQETGDALWKERRDNARRGMGECKKRMREAEKRGYMA